MAGPGSVSARSTALHSPALLGQYGMTTRLSGLDPGFSVAKACTSNASMAPGSRRDMLPFASLDTQPRRWEHTGNWLVKHNDHPIPRLESVDSKGRRGTEGSAA